MIDPSYWFMLPVGVFIATIAMMSGIGGAVLFSPFFMIVLKLEPVLAFTSGLIIEVFGFSSGVIGYLRQKSINFRIVKKILVFAIMGSVLGSVLSQYIPTDFLKVMLIILLLYLCVQFFQGEKKCQVKHPHITGVKKADDKQALASFMGIFTFIGGTLLGMISAGLGEINEYNLLKRMRLHVASASATSVFIVAVSAFFAVLTHLFFFLRESSLSVFSDSISIVFFAVPGVVIGAALVVYLLNKISFSFMYHFIGLLFLVLSILLAMQMLL